MKKSTITNLFSFSTGCLKNLDRGWLIATQDDLQEQGLATSEVFTWNRNSELKQLQLDWRAVSICRPSVPIDELLIIGEWGDIQCIRGSDLIVERLSDNQEREVGPIRCARAIDGSGYIAGMGREVYRREPSGRWQMIGPGDKGESEDTVCGFEGIDGFSKTDIYAAGWRGEIWRFDSRAWTQIQSPTNVSFTNVVCGGDGLVYICGPRGFLLRGRDSSWEVVEHDSTIEDLWGMCWFRNSLYISTLRCVYRLVGNSLKRLSLGTGAPPTCYHVTATDGIMWSIGAKDVREFDGRRWSKIII